MSIRLKRLAADFEKVRTLFQGGGRIQVLEHHGVPPERYVLVYSVKGLQQDPASRELRWLGAFHVEIVLPVTYPRMPPQCRMLTPAFHPNIAPHSICIGDHWAAGESLSNLIVRIGEMLAYQSYNVKSPLNGDAAQWAENNRQRLPTDTFDFSSLLSRSEVTSANPASQESGRCANCAAQGAGVALHACASGHVVCQACLFHCARCGTAMCMACDLAKCTVCDATVCIRCRARCASCGSIACAKDVTRCGICREIHCRNCLVKCSQCSSIVCVNHMLKRKRPEGVDYVCTHCGS